MANVNYTVVLDLTDNGCINTGWRLKQGDNGNSTIVVKIVDNGVDVYEPLSTPDIAFKRADGTSVLSTMTASDGYYNYTFVGNELAVAGPVVMDVTFTDEEARTSTASCRFEVVENPAGYDPEGAHTYDNPVSVLVEHATEDALIAEGFAVGQQRGQDVAEGSPYYHNNAKYYSELSDPTAFANMSDVDFNNLQNGQVPVYNSTSGKWENSSGGGGASALNDLTDVTITSASNGQVLKYDDVNHVWKNANESGGSGGSTIKVTTNDSTKFGEILTLSDGVTTLTTAFSFSGEAIFSGVTMTGNLTLTCEGDAMVVSVPYFGNYDFVFSAFAATITVSYPTGATCTCVGGGESQTATSNPQTFTVHSANTFRVTATVDGVDKYTDVTITTDGQTESVTIQFGTINVTLDAEFIGETITCVNGGTTISKTASTTSLVFYPPTTGTWAISGEVSGTTYSVDAVVSSLSTAVSVSLQTMPSVTVTIYSATEDTVLFTDASGAKTEVFASGQSSKTINITIPQGGMSITFTSSVAKEPSNYSQYYSKTVTVDENTTEVYLRPINALYWFGYMSDDCEKLATSNGWGISSGYSYDEPSFNTKSVYCNAGSNKIIGLGKKTTVAASKAFVVYTYASGGSAGILCTHSSKTTNGQSAYVEPTTTAHYAELSLSNHQNEYLTYSFNNQRSGYIEAFWY